MNRTNPTEGPDSTPIFDDPFLLPSSRSFPKSIRAGLDLFLFLYIMNPEYVQVSRRVFRYFIKGLSLAGADSAARDDLEELLVDKVDILSAAARLGDEYDCYGNAFVRVHLPFRRFLIYKGSYIDVEQFGHQIEFSLDKLEYTVPDPADLKRGVSAPRKVSLPFVDYACTDASRIRICFLDPRDVYPNKAYFSGEIRYLFKFPSYLKTEIKRNDIHQINNIPKDMLRVIRSDEDFLFAPGEIFHFKQDTVSGISESGWGTPNLLLQYRTLHQLQMYRKIDEVIAEDYTTPHRIFTPQIPAGADREAIMLILSSYKSEISRMVKERRRDKYAIHSLPFPIHYMNAGGEARNLVQKDLMEFQTDKLFDSLGFPRDLFKASLNLTQMPTAIRMMESTFYFIPRLLDRFVNFVATRVSKHLDLYHDVRVSMERPALADDLERKSMLVQLAAAGDVSKQYAFAQALGITDYKDKYREAVQENVELSEIALEAQQEAQRKQESGSMSHLTMQAADQAAMASDGAMAPPAVGGGGVLPDVQNMDPAQILQHAEELAMQYVQLPPGESSRALQQVKGNSEQLHAMVKQKMEEIRSSHASQGRASLRGGGI